VARVTLSIALTKRPWALVTLAPIVTADSFERGLELIRAGEFFAAHEELEDAWRAAEPAERDFLQGLVHVAVAWYQAGRGNRVGCERQLEKARRRLGPYAPTHRGVDISALLQQLEEAAATVAAGSLELAKPRL
jgi:predicted metal-dependent hydrolase